MDTVLERAFAEHGGPVLMGKKPAALFWVKGSYTPHMLGQAAGLFGLKAAVVRRKAGRVLLLMYNEDLLRQALNAPAAQNTLENMGYPVHGCPAHMVRHLARHIAQSGSFPHEVGFFLGYPPEDVLGFVQNKGGAYKLCGGWKVYGDVARARQLFWEYEQCKKCLVSHIEQGNSLHSFTAPAQHAG